MAFGDIDDAEFKAWAKRVGLKAKQDEIKKGLEISMRRVKAQSMRQVKSITPVDTGHLRNTWHVSGPDIAGKSITVKLYNNTEYASYVENGHRTRGGKGWVEGRFMLKKTVGIIDGQMDQLLSPSLNKALRELLE